MTPEFAVSDVVPHSGQMSLLDRICDWGEDWMSAEIDIRESSLFAEDEGIPAYISLEYMAQAIAAHSGLRERLGGGAPKLGFLLGTRKLDLPVTHFKYGTTLKVTVRCEFEADNGLGAFLCTLEAPGVAISATLNVFQPEDPQAYLQEQNP